MHVNAGTYAEHATVNKRLTLDGAGDTTVIDPATDGPAIAVTSGGTQANPLVISDLKTTGAGGGGNAGTGVALTGPVDDVTLQRVTSTGNTGNGFAVNSAGAFNRLKLDDVDLSSNTLDGARFPTSMGKLDGLTITNSNLDNNTFAGMEIYGPASVDPVTNVDITDTTFSGNGTKGIYAERLDHATLDGVTVNASGVTGANSAGIDLNLKKQTRSGTSRSRTARSRTPARAIRPTASASASSRATTAPTGRRPSPASTSTTTSSPATSAASASASRPRTTSARPA